MSGPAGRLHITNYYSENGEPLAVSMAASGRDIRLQVDGGVKVDNIAEIAAAGADMFVAGSAIFSQPDYKKVIEQMRAELAAVVS